MSLSHIVESDSTYTQTFRQIQAVPSLSRINSPPPLSMGDDGNGSLVKKTKPDGSKTLYVGGIYEMDKTSGDTVTRTVAYYPVAGAMRINIAGGSNTLYYILKDHLGSASVVTDASGVTVGEQRYYPYGATRWTTGTINTDKLFTGQRDTGLGIYHYGARFYSPYINRFLQPDTIVPGAANPQAWNRYSYVLGNPLKYTDPTGHMQESDDYKSSNGKCSKGDTSCNWVGKSKDKTKKDKSKDKSEGGGHPLSSPTQSAGNGGIGPCTINGVSTSCDVDIEVNATTSNLYNIAQHYDNLATELDFASGVAAVLAIGAPPVGVLAAFFYYEASNMNKLSAFYGNASTDAEKSASGTVIVQRLTSDQTYGLSSLAYKTQNGEGDVFIPVSLFTIIAITELKVR